MIERERRDESAEGSGIEYEQNRTKNRTLRHATRQIKRRRFRVVTRDRE
jgi:hypothetical protein